MGHGGLWQRHPHCTKTNVPRWPEVRSSISQSPCGSPAGSQLGASLVRHCGRGPVGRATGPALMCRWVSRSWAAEATGDMPAWRRGAGSSGIPDMRRLSQGVSMHGTGDGWGPGWQPDEVTEWCCNWSSLCCCSTSSSMLLPSRLLAVQPCRPELGAGVWKVLIPPRGARIED